MHSRLRPSWPILPSQAKRNHALATRVAGSRIHVLVRALAVGDGHPWRKAGVSVGGACTGANLRPADIGNHRRR
jgi:hypothetical protein